MNAEYCRRTRQRVVGKCQWRNLGGYGSSQIGSGSRFGGISKRLGFIARQMASRLQQWVYDRQSGRPKTWPASRSTSSLNPGPGLFSDLYHLLLSFDPPCIGFLSILIFNEFLSSWLTYQDLPLTQHGFWSGVVILHTAPSNFSKFSVHAWR